MTLQIIDNLEKFIYCNLIPFIAFHFVLDYSDMDLLL